MAHLKRLVAPKTWPTKRKGKVFAVRPHPRVVTDLAVPVSIVLRDMLKVVDTMAEARKILRERNVKVNGKVRTDIKFPVALFDVVEIPSISKKYLVTFTRLGKLALEEGDIGNYRLLRIEGKTKVSGGKTQLNLFDGTNILAEKDAYKIGDVLKLSVPENKVLGKISPSSGAKALVIRGSHRGEVAAIESLNLEKSPKEVTLKNESGSFLTRFDYIHLSE